MQLAIIGSGMAGFAASVFALDRGIKTAQVGNTGAVAYTTGYLDLLGGDQHSLLTDPWRALVELRQHEPRHPLARIGEQEIRTALARFTHAVSEMGIAYTSPGETNLMALSPAGTLKPTCSVPRTMLPGIEAMTQGAPTLIVDFDGLKGFSAAELVANLRDSWPELRAARIAFPDLPPGQVYPEVMARALEVSTNRDRVAELIRPLIGNAGAVGVPAVLGMHNPDRVQQALQQLLGVPLFEIPTIPPAVPGIRLREMFEQCFPERGLTLVPQQKVTRIDLTDAKLRLSLRDSYGEVEILAQAAVLATGRFLSGGLFAGRNGIRETLLDIPVTQPAARSEWYRERYFDRRGHPLNRAGIEVDDHFRPLDAAGRRLDPRLFAAGILLAHQDWTRQRCGAGVAIASAYQAVKGAVEVIGQGSAATRG
ncbi:MAG: glycerol-3-phosphate dehydrogenase subunit GlpB [Gammaproteobacteria bacterium]|nr:glycerol-3-phosphate dehydrogenase subunit GlpB [Gammaproteobacteria bacterium]